MYEYVYNNYILQVTLNPQVYLVLCRKQSTLFQPLILVSNIMFLYKQRWARCFRDDKYYGAIDTNNGTESLNKALKYSFLPRKKNMTLTGLVKLLTEQFLPDIHQHYLFDTSTTYLRITGSSSFIVLLLTQCLITFEEGLGL